MLAQLFRSELLEALRYGEISYRKYCELLVNPPENKTVRSFLHLPLQITITTCRTPKNAEKNDTQNFEPQF